MENQVGSESPTYGLPTVKSDQPAEPAKIGPGGRLIGVLVSPGETFADINRKPTWLIPMLLGIVFYTAYITFFNIWVKPDYDKMVRAQAQKQAERFGTPAPAPEALALQVKITKISMYVIPVIGIPVADFAIAGIFALGMLLLSANTTYKKILSVFAWTGCSVGLVYWILSIAVLFVRDKETLSEIKLEEIAAVAPTHLGVLFQSSESAVLKALATSIDIFTIWQLILLTIGFAAISGSRKITKSSTATVVVALWIVWVLIKVGIAALGFGPR